MEKKMTKDPYNKNRNIYLLGVRKGVYYWLKEPTWNTNGHWGFGYVITYTNNETPDSTSEVLTYQHFDRIFLSDKEANSCYTFKEFFDETPFSEYKLKTFMELMESYYTCTNFANLCNTGWSNDINNPVKNKLINKDMCETINNVMIPEIFQKLRLLLSPSSDN